MNFDIFANLVNPKHWFNPEPPPPSILFAVFLFVGVLATAVLAYIRVKRRVLFMGDGLKIRLAARFTEIGLWLFGSWLFLIAMRYLRVPFLATPILMYMTTLALLAFGGYLLYYFTQKYPQQRTYYEAQAERARYLPGARRPRAASPARPDRRRSAAKRR